jgi:protein SCO1
VDVRAISEAVGFRDRFDMRLKQFLHPAGIVFVTPGGVVSSYLLGVGYAPGDVRLGVTRASTGSIAARALPVLLLCFHFDPTTGRYTLAVLKLLELGAGLTVLVLGGTLLLAFRRERRQP